MDDGIGECIEEVLRKSRASASDSKPKAMASDNWKDTAISLYFYKWNSDMDYTNLGADRLYFPFAALDRPGFSDAAKAVRKAGVEVFGWLPSVTRGNYDKLIERFFNKKELKESEQGAGHHGIYMIDGVLAGNLGTINKIKGITNSTSGLKLAGDISLNLFNLLSIQEAAKMGLDSIALSAEMTMQQITGLSNINALPVIETAVYGRLPLMTSEYCPVGCAEGGFNSASRCSGCCSKGEYKLKDRLGMEFPILCDKIDCRSTILNSNALFVPDSLRDLKAAGTGVFRMYIWDEAPDVVKELVQLYRAAVCGSSKWAEARSGLTERIKAAGFTKGHYYRGV
jgi:putative protease